MSETHLLARVPGPAWHRAPRCVSRRAGLLETAALTPWTIWLGDPARLRAGGEPRFLVTYGPGPSWEEARSRREQAGWDEHAALIDGLAADGIVVFGGPVDERHAVLVMRAAGREPLHDRLDPDSWVGGVLLIDLISPWELWL